MYNCTKHHSQLAVAQVTKDHAAQPHLPSTVENQLGRRRRRQLLTIAQWNIRTLLDREGNDRPERRTPLVAMELAKYDIDIAAQAQQRVLQTKNTRSTTAAYKDACQLLQKRTRALKSDWWKGRQTLLKSCKE